jgi:parallel beta-helix repeat protein
MAGQPAAFMSYVRFDDRHDDGQLTGFRERLAAEVRVQAGEEFLIFQDRADIAWGQNWQQRIDQALDTVTLLLVIITPGFFRSPHCRAEVEQFLDRERQLGRDDLILPVYYVSTPEFDDPGRRDADPLAAVLAARQYADWRELRFESTTSPAARRAIAHLATGMRDTFWHPPASTPDPARAAWADPAGLSVPQTPQAAPIRAAARIEPSTHVVDLYHRGDFTTLSEAIKAAGPGDRILVRAGLYSESLVIDKPLEIVGDGPAADIQLHAHDAHVVVFRASIGRIANLTLRQAGGEGQWYGVDIAQGRLDLEGCDITSQSSACVAIHDGADPRLRRNTIHDGNQNGVYVHDRGLGTLEDNDITGNASAGVEITTGGNPTLRRNTIHHGKKEGVHVHDHGLGILEGNDIAANVLAGVEITTGGNPTLRRNTIHDGINAGVCLHDRGLGTLEDNDITGNAHPGVAITTGSNPTLRRNTIHDGKSAGIYVYEQGLGTFEGNDITGNAGAGVAITTGGNPMLRRNTIHDGKRNGVYVVDQGLGTFEDNDITANAHSGVAITTGSNPTLRRNRINRNGYQAVQILRGGKGVIEDNDLTGNKQGAWNIAAALRLNVLRGRNRGKI